MSVEPLQQRSVGRNVALLLMGWLFVAAAVGLAGWFQARSAPFVAATVWMLTLLVLLACWKVSVFKNWVMNVDLRFYT
jgi:antibiotic biosynthesis monooxygenase (ABM) superfamily enzyme